jgi:transcriptional regulator with XRE-family HTH domain
MVDRAPVALLRLLRAAEDLSQLQVVGRCGLSPARYRAAESLLVRLEAHELESVATALGLDDLRLDLDLLRSPSPTARELLDAIRLYRSRPGPRLVR